METTEFQWVDIGTELVDGNWVPYTRPYTPPTDNPQAVQCVDPSPRDRFFALLNMGAECSE